MTVPHNYLERVYAGVLGKLIGVYLGRPFENWTYQRITEELGPIEYYVNDRLGVPLVVTDDDVGGTFTFIRALEDHGISEGLTSRQIGETWLNYLIENRSILWWGGNGNSTEHTAWLNLKRGVPAPLSGAIATNGQIIAEQIGAQIFIDGWALVSPGRPDLAARLAQQAARVSHDGEAVNAAMLWAAMEAEAFVDADIDHLLDTGLAQIPRDSLIARLAADVRAWRAAHSDWRTTRALIEANYGYEKYLGNCHVVPNHALMLMAALYAPHDFGSAMTIVNTSGWDTDCNAGNVGCLLGILNGTAGMDAGPDWRGPLADRMLISSADGGNAISDAVTQAYYLANLGQRLAGEEPRAPPKSGARFHFSLVGSRQGFRPVAGASAIYVDNVAFEDGRALAIDVEPMVPGSNVAVTTPCFGSVEVLEMRTYELVASPLLYSGQVIKARIAAARENSAPVDVALRIRVYDERDKLSDLDGPRTSLPPGLAKVIEFRVPDTHGQPIAEVGVALSSEHKASARIIVDYLLWEGAPQVKFHRPPVECDFWRRAWVNGADVFTTKAPQSFRIAQNHGEGLISCGTRQWTNYRVRTEIIPHLGDYFGVAMRVQGLRRYYGVRLTRTGELQIVRAMDESIDILVSSPYKFNWDEGLLVDVLVHDRTIAAKVGDTLLQAKDASDRALGGGAVGLFVYEGAISVDAVEIAPCESDFGTEP